MSLMREKPVAMLRDFFVREREGRGDRLSGGHKSASAENTLSQKENFLV